MIEKKSTEAREKMMNALAVLHEDLASLPEVPEVEWTRMRAVEFQDLLRGRLTLSDRIAKLGCQLCEDFDGHVSYTDRGCARLIVAFAVCCIARDQAGRS